MRVLLTFTLLVIGATLEPAAVSSSPIDAKNADEQIARERALAKRGDGKEAIRVLDGLIPALRGAGNSVALGKALTDLSMLLAEDGDYKRARNAALQARSVSHSLNDNDAEARAVDNLGVAELFLGDYQGAQSSFAAELVLVRKLNDAQAEVQAANNLGSAFFYQGSYTRAMLQYQVATSVLQNSTNRSWYSYWNQVTSVNIATLYQRLGELDKALKIYRTVQASEKFMDAADEAQLLSNLGALYRHLGDSYKALDSYQKALSLMTHAHNSDGSLGILQNIGALYGLDRNDLPQAETYFHRVLALAASSGNRAAASRAHLYLGEAYLRSRDFETADSEFSETDRSAGELGFPEDRWQAQYGLGRVASARGDGGAAERHFRAAIATIESVRVQIHEQGLKGEFLAEKREVYDALIRLLLHKGDVTGVFDVLERSRARVFQDRLGAKESQLAKQLTVPVVQSRLDSNTLLLEFWVADGEIAVLWVTRDRYGVVSRNLTSGDWRLLNAFVEGLPDNLSGNWRREVDALGQIIPQPFSPFSRRDLSHILVVPDGIVSTVPIELVPIDPNQVLIERYDVSYLPSAALLLRSPPAGSSLRFPWEHQLTAFGAPTLGKQNGGSALTFDDAPAALPGSAVEIRAISHIIPGRANTYLGPGDNRSNFQGGAANTAPLLHISTHAFADMTNSERTRLLFSPAEGMQGRDYVFLRELDSLDLSRVDMATISACETERGKLVRGEGIEAFSRALLAAGARSAVTTLWRIDDAATAEFMKQFYYFAVLKRQTKSEALRLAKLKLLNSGTSLAQPRHWAAFELSGDPGRLALVFVPWSTLISFFALALAALFLIAGLLIRLWHQQRIDRGHRVR